MTTIGSPKGTLLIHGGGNISSEFQEQFKKLAGGVDAKIVFIPTADSPHKLSSLTSPITSGSVFGISATIMHTCEQSIANADSFVRHLRSADGVFISGGRQPRLAQAYLNTMTHHELENLFKRGGVIAGSSAGATIMGSFMVRNQGAPDYCPDYIVDWRYPTEGFGFIKNAAIDQHITKRGRQTHLEEVLKARPELLGIGIDEDTAIIVHNDEFEVVGSGKVFIHDGTLPYYTLVRGQRYNLQARSVCK